MRETVRHSYVAHLTLQIVAAYISRNDLAPNELPRLVELVHDALASPEHAGEKPPAPLPNGVFDDYIVCLEDGKKLRMLKSHLLSSHNMTPEEYRVKWGLPADYPMVAPDYSAFRSVSALKHKLGRKPEGVPLRRQIRSTRLWSGG
jgi:predicted transcriptional regulator